MLYTLQENHWFGRWDAISKPLSRTAAIAAAIDYEEHGVFVRLVAANGEIITDFRAAAAADRRAAWEATRVEMQKHWDTLKA